MTYPALDAAVTVANIHVGQVGVNGGISVFLCSNLADPPAGIPACPLPGGTVRGTLTTASVVGPATQNIGTGDFAKLLQAMCVGATYVNVHSADFAAGEIRGQIRLTANGSCVKLLLFPSGGPRCRRPSSPHLGAADKTARGCAGR